MKKLWADRAWDDYLYWQTQDKKTLKRIDDVNRLVYNIDENGFLWIIACRGHYED